MLTIKIAETERKSRQLASLLFSPPSPPTPPRSFSFFLINTARVVRLCLIMHDRYQQQTPLNEAPLNGNTIIPPGAQEERQDCFSSFLSVLISVRWEAAEHGAAATAASVTPTFISTAIYRGK